MLTEKPALFPGYPAGPVTGYGANYSNGPGLYESAIDYLYLGKRLLIRSNPRLISSRAFQKVPLGYFPYPFAVEEGTTDIVLLTVKKNGRNNQTQYTSNEESQKEPGAELRSQTPKQSFHLKTNISTSSSHANGEQKEAQELAHQVLAF